MLSFETDQERHEWVAEFSADLQDVVARHWNVSVKPSSSDVTSFVSRLADAGESIEGPNSLDAEWLITGWLMWGQVPVEEAYEEACGLVESYWHG